MWSTNSESKTETKKKETRSARQTNKKKKKKKKRDERGENVLSSFRPPSMRTKTTYACTVGTGSSGGVVFRSTSSEVIAAESAGGATAFPGVWYCWCCTALGLPKPPM